MSSHHGGPQNGQAAVLQPLPPAEKLARLVARHALPEEHVAKQLGWDLDKLRTYLSPENRQAAVAVQRSSYASPEMEHAVEKLLTRYEIAQAANIVKRSASKLLAPAMLTMRRAHSIPQLARYMTDRRSVFQPVTSSTDSLAHDAQPTGDVPGVANRKRKRKAVVKALSEFETLSRLRPSADFVCPVRIDVDVDGVRYQDTLLINAAAHGVSPDEIAGCIARDEHLSDVVRDAISESIKRQIITFSSFVDVSSESLHPIHLDIVIGSVSLRDQFEWDICSDLNDAEVFATTLCADLNLPPVFESAIAFSIREQVYGYRRIIFGKQWIGNDPLAQKAAAQGLVQPRSLGISTIDPVEDTVVREPEDAVLWQPVVSELGPDELQYFTAKLSAARRSVVPKKTMGMPHANGQAPKRSPKFRKETKAPRPINPFILFCQVQKDLFSGPKHKRSAAESRKILGDMWRKMTDEEKEYYAQLTEAENEKRRREHVFDLRDRAISDWEDDEARRIGLLGSSVLDATTDHVRGLLLANYMDERHEVDSNRTLSRDEVYDDDEEEGDPELAESA